MVFFAFFSIFFFFKFSQNHQKLSYGLKNHTKDTLRVQSNTCNNVFCKNEYFLILVIFGQLLSFSVKNPKKWSCPTSFWWHISVGKRQTQKKMSKMSTKVRWDDFRNFNRVNILKIHDYFSFWKFLSFVYKSSKKIQNFEMEL